MVRLPKQPPRLADLLDKVTPRILLTLFERLGTLEDGRYLHWEEVRRRPPPAGLTHEQWWFGMKLMREAGARHLSLLDKNGVPFSYSLVGPVLEKLQRLDFRAAGRLNDQAAALGPPVRGRYQVRGMIEEAISSSLLEGAVSARTQAKEMLLSRRRPRNHSERMITNNYRAIRRVREMIGSDLTPEMIQEMCFILTEETHENPESVGRFQRPQDRRVNVVDTRDGTVVHIPPPAEEIPERIERLCDFANGEEEGFTHPLIRAIMLQFWLVYVHPFVDGNGRTARALFYWSALRSGYWLAEYVSISSPLLRAPTQYTRSFLYSNAGCDVTYFLMHQLKVLDEAFDDLNEYVDYSREGLGRAGRLTHTIPGLNLRQRALLADALRNPLRRYTFQGHASRHGVVPGTARTDLLELQARGLLDKDKEGKRYVFIAPEDLARRLDALRPVGHS